MNQNPAENRPDGRAWLGEIFSSWFVGAIYFTIITVAHRIFLSSSLCPTPLCEHNHPT